MKKSSKKSTGKVRFNYRNEEGFLCLALFIERKIGRFGFTISMYEDKEHCYIEITPKHSGCIFYTYIIDSIVDCVRRVVKDCDVFFDYSFDVKDNMPYCHISCSKDSPLPF